MKKLCFILLFLVSLLSCAKEDITKQSLVGSFTELPKTSFVTVILTNATKSKAKVYLYKKLELSGTDLKMYPVESCPASIDRCNVFQNGVIMQNVASYSVENEALMNCE